ncbi:MAG TPA: aminotransferase class V-fold PLP-dependent enzyme [Thermomicrobiaceae bacterium]|nr:aminotransferase class V-fold PLP-dependent enzyme [Thermomicrobiaceae bacterium]
MEGGRAGSIYERFGVRPLINARGTHTRLGGTLMHPEVVDAMRAAAGSYVVLDELQDRASALIARATGAEAGMVTGGAAAGLLFGTAACIAGSDPGRIERLPDTTGMNGEVVVHRAHRNGYDHSVRATGARLVEVGYGHATSPDQLEGAITEQTAMVFYVVAPWASRGALPLAETCAIAHRHRVPVLVDAAAMLPPADNLRRFIAEGADLVTFSGGKGLRGPQSSGILAGRAPLIAAARANASPNHSVGRAAKAAKEDIVGLMVALELYLNRDHAAEHERWMGQACYVVERLGGLSGVTASVCYDGHEHPSPRVEVVFDRRSGVDAHALVLALEEGDPRVFLFEPNGPGARPNSLVVHLQTLRPGEEEVVAEVLRAAVARRLSGQVEPGA